MPTINILIVDDTQEDITALITLLKRDDVKIFSSTSINEALKLALENHISIALVDVQMPYINGFEFVEMLKSNPLNKNMFVIYITEIVADHKYALKNYENSVVDYLYKPINAYIALAKVDAFIQLARYRQDIKQKGEGRPSKQPKSNGTTERAKKVKETFLANMSHELRTPVNGIIGLTNLLRKTPLNDQQSSMVDLLEVSSQSLSGVINDVLDFSKMEAGKFSIIRSVHNVHSLVKSVYGLLKFKADENNVEFLLNIAPDVPAYIIIDPLRLNQILMNLLSNAIKFTKRGYVKLQVSVVQQQTGKVKLQFIVEDSGIGIPGKCLVSIFDPFEQAEANTAAKYGGTGLGLTIVKKLIELKGGELIVNSQLGKGSTFGFTNWYTIAEKHKENLVVKTEKKLHPFENISILVAEDNLVNQFMLAKMLKEWDVEMDMVDNGHKVLEKLRLKNYDLVLMDTNMPEMNGYQAAKIIRTDFDEPQRSVQIISLSAASGAYAGHDEALAVGMNDVLAKPFYPHQLHCKIQKLLNINIEL